MNVRTLMMYLSRLPQDAQVSVRLYTDDGESHGVGSIEDIEHTLEDIVTIIAVD